MTSSSSAAEEAWTEWAGSCRAEGVNTDYRMFYPYSLMLAGMNSNRSEDLLVGQMPAFFLSCAAFLILFFALGIGYLKKADVRA